MNLNRIILILLIIFSITTVSFAYCFYMNTHPPMAFPKLSGTIGASISSDQYYREYWKIPETSDELTFYLHLGNYQEKDREMSILFFVDYLQVESTILNEKSKVHEVILEPGEYKKLEVKINADPGEHELFALIFIQPDEIRVHNEVYTPPFLLKSPKVKFIVK